MNRTRVAQKFHTSPLMTLLIMCGDIQPVVSSSAPSWGED